VSSATSCRAVATSAISCFSRSSKCLTARTHVLIQHSDDWWEKWRAELKEGDLFAQPVVLGRLIGVGDARGC
jgi:hypothetical protein